jgi:hypothetical protein
MENNINDLLGVEYGNILNVKGDVQYEGGLINNNLRFGPGVEHIAKDITLVGIWNLDGVGTGILSLKTSAGIINVEAVSVDSSSSSDNYHAESGMEFIGICDTELKMSGIIVLRDYEQNIIHCERIKDDFLFDSAAFSLIPIPIEYQFKPFAYREAYLTWIYQNIQKLKQQYKRSIMNQKKEQQPAN